MAFQVLTSFPVPVDGTMDQLSAFLRVPKGPGPKAGLRPSTQKLGVDYLPNASLPLAGSRSQRGVFFFFPNSFWAHGLEIARGCELQDPGPLSSTAAEGENGYGLSGGQSDLKCAWPLT